MNSKDLFSYGLLSEVTYAELDGKNTLDDTIYEKDNLKNLLALKESGPDSGWAAALADEFVKHWRVVSHRPNTSSGFSATLYERLDENENPAGEFVLAPRGTETEDIRDLQADVEDLVANGLAWRQIIDLYNYWQEIATPAGSTYSVAKAVPLSFTDARRRQLELREAGIVIEPERLVLGLPAAWKIVVEDSGQPGRGVVPAGQPVGVAGHSLGGHLATAFSRLFPSQTGSVLSVNGAGYRLNELNPTPVNARYDQTALIDNLRRYANPRIDLTLKSRNGAIWALSA